MDKKLFSTALGKFVAGVVIIGLLLFAPAGTLVWWQGWLFMGILFVPMFVAGLVMMSKAPDLLRKRLDAKEEESEQRTVLALSALMFVAAFVVAGLGIRFGWIELPSWVTWVGVVIFLVSYALYAEVMRENAYLSRTIEVQEGQHVVDTGMYGIVSHPMYSVTLFRSSCSFLCPSCSVRRSRSSSCSSICPSSSSESVTRRKCSLSASRVMRST